MVKRIMVAGVGTDVGKTVVSGILTMLFEGDYWKPIQCGPEERSDSAVMRRWLQGGNHKVYPSIYTLQAPISPHSGARLENRCIEVEAIEPPVSLKPLIIEGVGGIMVPLTWEHHTLDLFARWECQWVVVSRHYLGSINHTLLTLERLKERGLPVLGIVFNGPSTPDTESVILQMSGVPLLGALCPEPYLNKAILQKYVAQWRPQFALCLN